MKPVEYSAGYRKADADNVGTRAGLIEAIAEPRRESFDPKNDEPTRAYWRQKAKRWKDNLAGTRALALMQTLEDSQ